MSKLTMYAIEAELLSDGTVMLGQKNYCDEDSYVCMDLVQLAIISDRFLTKQPQQTQSDAHAFVMEEHARLLKELGDVIDDLHDDKLGYFDDIAESCHFGAEIAIQLRIISDLSYSLERHLRVLAPESEQEPSKNMSNVTKSATVVRHENKPANYVTGNSVTKRGRPPIGDAPMTDAERQRASRERKAQEKSGQLELEAATPEGSQS